MSKIQNIVNEEIMSFINESVVMGIIDLANIIADRIGGGEMEAEAFRRMLSDAFRKGGNEEVKDMYTKITGNELEDMSRGKFMFKEGITGIGGVLDRATKKRFGIPNQHRELDRQ